MSTRAALRYAKAVLNLAYENKAEDTVSADMQLILATVGESVDLQNVLNNPTIKIQEKVAALSAIFGNQVSSFTTGLINLLGENKRLNILTEVAKQYVIIYDFSKAKDVAIVTTAVAITKEIETLVVEKVKTITGKVAKIENVINPEILGGFILRVGDVQYDASIASNLRDLEKSFDISAYQSKI